MEELLRQLVAYQTVEGDESKNAALKFIADYLSERGMHVEHFKENGYGALVATTIPGQKHPKVMLAAHVDVVSASLKSFTMRKKQGKFYGRGVFDMKFAIATFMRVVDRLQPTLSQYDFGIMITSDEEIGGVSGVKYLLDHGYGADVCLLPDGADDWHIEAQAKGGWNVRVSASGKSSHGSRPWEGESAADKIIDFMTATKREFPPSPDHTDTTVVLTGLQAGKSWNQVPGHAEATLDIRYLNGAYPDIRRRLRILAKTHDVSLHTNAHIEAVYQDMDSRHIYNWERVVKSVRGETMNEYTLSFGASDARFLVAQGIPTIVTRPKGGGHHGENEWIDEAELDQFEACVQQYIQAVAKTTQPTTVDQPTKTRYNTTKLPETATS